jgi:hypothetical protein
MINCQFRPLTAWPSKRTAARRASPFNSAHAKTLKLLEAELNKLSARDIIIQAELSPSDIRNDGWPRSDARFKAPGIVLSYVAGGKTYVFPCDSFVSWQDNLRAIALTLENLRAIDRYGVTRGEQQYAGFRQLGAADPTTERAAALETLAQLSECSLGDNPSEFDIDVAYRAAAKLTHPDRHGGKSDSFIPLGSAMLVLRPKTSEVGR